jgi:hypothetical protein
MQPWQRERLYTGISTAMQRPSTTYSRVTLGSVWPPTQGASSAATGGLVIDGDNDLDAAAVVNGSAFHSGRPGRSAPTAEGA